MKHRVQREVNTIDDRVRALTLRKMGKSYDDIAEEMGLKNKQAAHYLVQAALKKVIKEPAQDVLQVELERLDLLYSSIIERAMSGDVKAIHAALAVMDRRSRLLGLERKEERELLYQANVIAAMLVTAIKSVVSPETIPLIQAAFANVLHSGVPEIVDGEYKDAGSLPELPEAIDIEADDAET